MSLKDLINNLNEVTAKSTADPDTFDPRVRISVEGDIRASKEKLVQLERQYIGEVKPHIVPIVLTGSDKLVNEFISVAKEDFNTFAIDFKLMITKIIDVLREARLPDKFNRESFWATTNQLMNIKANYNISYIQPMQMGYLENIIYEKSNREALEALVKDNYGTELYSIITVTEIARQALIQQFKGKYFPALVYNCLATDFDIRYIQEPITTILVDNISDMKEFVKESLLSVKGKLTRKGRTDNDKGGDECK